MDLIAPPGPRAGRWVVVLSGKDKNERSAIVRAQRHMRSVRRRRRFLGLLIAATLASLVTALVRSGGWWEIHAGLVAALVLYVGVLLEAKKRQRERLTKVRPLRRTRQRTSHPSAAVGGER